MKLPIDQLIRALGREAFYNRKAVAGLFVATNLLMVVVGLAWPSGYTASTTVLVEEKNIIQPLMQGAAVPTGVEDRAKLATEVIYSNKVIHEVMDAEGWLKDNPSPAQQSRIADGLRGRTSITSTGPNLIKIEYRDGDARRAYEIVRKYAELFIAASLEAKKHESQRAFQFIDQQAEAYHQKLTEVEDKLRDFRSANLDAAPGNEGDVNTRLGALQARIDQSKQDIEEARTKKRSLEKQLSGESESVVALSREGQYAQRVAELQSRLDTLRLSYTETYPDIVQIKHQIEDLREAMADEQKRRAHGQANGQTRVDEAVLASSPIYVQLKHELSQVQVQIDTLNARIGEAKREIEDEVARGKRMQGGEATLAELTRDYQVNRDIYQDLLRRREAARVSMNLDIANDGLTLKIQEPATLPLQPSGLRFMDFVIAGFLLGIAVPVGLLYARLEFDPRIRLPALLAERTKLPVLAAIPHSWSPGRIVEARRELLRDARLVAWTIALVGLAGVLRLLKVV